MMIRPLASGAPLSAGRGFSRMLCWVRGFAVFLVLSGSAAAQHSYVIKWIPQSQWFDGSEVRFALDSQRTVVRGETGSFVGDINAWKRSTPPFNIESQLARLRTGQDFKYWWADNVVTLVVVRVRLNALPGFPDDAGIDSMGLVTTAATQNAGTLEERLELALKEAVRRMPSTLEGNGISDSIWKRLRTAAEKNGWEGGVPFELVLAYDSRSGDQTIWNLANKWLNQRSSKVRRVPFMMEKLREMAKLYVAGKHLDSLGTYARMYAGSDDLPAAWFWQAWLRVDQGDYGPKTLELVANAERALRKWADVGPEIPLLVDSNRVSLYGGPETGQRRLDDFQRINGAYVHYLRGIVEENLANRTKDESEARSRRNAAEAAFKQWFEECRYGAQYVLDDPVMMRAAGIALHNGTRGYPRDEPAAIEMFELAAEAGSADALNWLGTIFDFKGGKYTDPKLAVGYYEKGAAKGSLFAKRNLGLLYIFGAGGLPQDRSKGYSLYLDGTRPGGAGAKDKLFGGQTSRTPDFERHLSMVFAPSAEAESPDGSKLTVTGASGDYPVSLIAAPGKDFTEGRDLKFKVEYRVPAGVVARLVIEPAWDGYASEPDGQLFTAPAVKVEGNGEQTLWIGSGSPAQYLGSAKISLLHATEKRVLVSAEVAVVARWDRGIIKKEKTTAPAKSDLSNEAIQKLDQRYNEARKKFSDGDNAGAIAILDEVLRQFPNSGNAWLIRGTAKGRLNDLKGANDDLTAAIQLMKKDPAIWATRAQVRFQQNDLAGSLADIDEALRLKPKDMELLEMRGEVYVAMGKVELALDDFNRVIEADPKNTVALYQRGMLQEMRKDVSAALSDYSRVIQLDPKQQEALHKRAWIRFNRDDFAGALEDGNKTLALDPNANNTRRLTGYAKFALGDFAGAAAALAEANGTRKDSDAGYAWLIRHFALARLGKTDARLAREMGTWEKQPWLQSLARFALGQIDEERLEAAARASKDPAEVQGQLCEMHFYAGLARLQAKDRTAARMHFQAALATKLPNYTEYHLAGAELKRP